MKFKYWHSRILVVVVGFCLLSISIGCDSGGLSSKDSDHGQFVKVDGDADADIGPTGGVSNEDGLGASDSPSEPTSPDLPIGKTSGGSGGVISPGTTQAMSGKAAKGPYIYTTPTDISKPFPPVISLHGSLSFPEYGLGKSRDLHNQTYWAAPDNTGGAGILVMRHGPCPLLMICLPNLTLNSIRFMYADILSVAGLLLFCL